MLQRVYALWRARITFWTSLLGMIVALSMTFTYSVSADGTYFQLCSGTTPNVFSQNWTNAGLITANDNWSGVPSIIGYRGDDITAATGADPQTLLGEGTVTVDVNANQTNPTTFTTGGVTEFDLTDDTIALAGSGTADAPNIVIHLNTTGAANINITYNLRDIEGSIDNATQSVALQYRVGASGNFTNIPAGYVADATTGPSLATLVTLVNVDLPVALENQSQVQLRIMTTNAAGNDEWVGIDDISITPSCASDTTPAVSSTTPANGAVAVSVTSDVSITFSEPVNVAGDWFTIACATSGNRTPMSGTIVVTPAGPAAVYTLNPNTSFANGESCTVIVENTLVTDSASQPMDADYTFSFTVENSLVYIHDIQGAGSTSPFDGTTQTIDGIVTFDYQTAAQLSGFYLQEEDADVDANPLTSEGIFVFALTPNVNVGDRVTVTGVISEYVTTSGIFTSSLTEITPISIVLISSGNALPASATLDLPLAPASREPFEGMRVSLPDTLTVNEHFQLGRYGQLILSDNGVPQQYTQNNAPSAAGNAAYLTDLASHRIYLDDVSSVQNPDPIIFARGGSPLSASNTLRIGDTLSGLTGVLDERYEGYRIQTNASQNFVAANPRPAYPSVAGDITIASFNVLNYFNGPTFPTSRGAETPGELTRQQDKEISALVGLNADIYGLMELENDSGAGQAAETLVGALNTVVGAGTYTFIDTGVVGSDEIRVGLIYNPGVVTPIGSPLLDTNPVHNRPPLAQLFEVTDPANPSFGERFVVIVNHFKSKGCTGAAGGDLDSGDGQSCFSATRVAQANALASWITTTVMTTTGEPDVLLIGDFNSYANENPITSLVGSGYNLLTGGSNYSYVFDGVRGTLDQALVSANLFSQVAGFTEWHINADEPSVIDYNTNFKSVGQITSLYSSDAFRSSDHDPILIGLSLVSASVELSGAGGTLAENGSQQLTVTLDTPAALTADLVVPLNIVAGSTTASASDYSLPVSVTFPLGSTDGATVNATLQIIDDSKLEGSETVAVEIGTVSGASVTGTNLVTVTIADDETAYAGFVSNASSSLEASGAAFTVAVQLTVQGTTGTSPTWELPLGTTLTFNVIHNPAQTDTATISADYLSGGSYPIAVTFDAIETINVPFGIVDDALLEGDEYAYLALQADGSNPADVGTNLTAVSEHTVTINEDETVTVGFENATSASANEATAPTINVIAAVTDTTAAVGDGAIGAGVTVTVNANVISGSATGGGTDYTFANPETLTFTGAALTQPLTLTLVDDSLIEGSEDIVFQLDSLTSTGTVIATYSAIPQHTSTITEDDIAAVTFTSASSNSGSEAFASHNIPFTLSLIGTTASPATLAHDMTVRVNDNTANGTATEGAGSDYNVSTSSVYFPAGTIPTAPGNFVLGSFVIDVYDDANVEGNETVELELNLVDAAPATSNSPTIHTFTIVDDDTAAVGFAQAEVTVGESATSVNLPVVITIPNSGTYPTAVTGDVNQTGGSATNGGDYTFANPQQASFLAGTLTTTVNVPVTLNPDADIEGEETIIFTLSNLSSSSGLSLGAQTTITVRITDDDSASVSFGAPNTAIAPEVDAPLSIPVTLNVPGSGTILTAVTVDVSVTSSTATEGAGNDFTYTTQMVTFPAGSASGTQNVTLNTLADTVSEGDEQIVLGLSNLTGTSVTLATPTDYTITITDDDVEGVIQFQQAAQSVAEDTANTFNIPVVLNGATITAPFVFTVTDAGTLVGSATASVDYVFVDPGTLTFPAGSPGGTIINIPITITADAAVEGFETIILTLNITSGGTIGANATHTITIQEEESTGGSGSGAPTPTPIPAVVFVCENIIAQTNGDITARGSFHNVSQNGVIGDVYCRIIARNQIFLQSQAEVGIQLILNMGVIHAINVYGMIPGGYPVVPFIAPMTMCLRGSGDVLFINAGDITHAPVRLGGNMTSMPGFVCVSVPGSGLVVMVNGSSGLGQASSAPASGNETPLADCRVTTTNQVNLRSTPEMGGNANVLAVLPYNITLQASAYNSLGWYKVIFENMQGYVIDDYVSTSGNCGG